MNSCNKGVTLGALLLIILTCVQGWVNLTMQASPSPLAGEGRGEGARLKTQDVASQPACLSAKIAQAGADDRFATLLGFDCAHIQDRHQECCYGLDDDCEIMW